MANTRANDFLTRAEQLQDQYGSQRKIDVFYEVWNSPLFTINDTHIISDVIRLCGGKNIFSDAIPLVPKVSVETVLRRNPQVIIASGMGDERPEWLDDWWQWKTIDAVKNKQLYFVPPDLLQRHTVRILSGAEIMCEHLAKARALLVADK